MRLPESLTELMEHLERLPGIGSKSSFRYALEVSRWDADQLVRFSRNLEKITNLKYCEACQFFCEEKLCSVCDNQHRRSSKKLCVVEGISDYVAIENTGTYHGTYFILGGVLNPLLGIGPKELKLEKLFKLMREWKTEEIILAINPSVEGDATCSYIESSLGPEVRVERLGFGIPIGGHLEYLDPLTINKAFESRTSLR